MPVRTEELQIPSGKVKLSGALQCPALSKGVVLFAHGSGSSRHSPRNQSVAQMLIKAGIGTLLFDLLTPEEETADSRTAQWRFDIRLLAQRLLDATVWFRESHDRNCSIGFFGASTGGGAALVAAAQLANRHAVAAVVSRGGRPDLAGEFLPRVAAPTLLLVGSHDPEVIRLNEQAYDQLRCAKELTLIPGATHLFEEPGTLAEVARLASIWFNHYFEQN